MDLSSPVAEQASSCRSLPGETVIEAISAASSSPPRPLVLPRNGKGIGPVPASEFDAALPLFAFRIELFGEVGKLARRGRTRPGTAVVAATQ